MLRRLRKVVGEAVRPVPVPYRIDGHTMLIPRGESGHYRSGYEPITSHWIREHARRASTHLVDVGAHVGYFTLLLHASAGVPVTAVEPVPQTARILRANLTLNNARRARVLVAAAGAIPDQRELRLVHGSSQHGFYDSPNTEQYGSMHVRQVRLDDVINGIDGAKIDAEGAEIEVLKGMERLLDARPWLVVEWAPHIQEAAGNAPADLLDALRRYGYQLTVLDDQPGRSLTIEEGLRRIDRGEQFFVNLAATT